MPQDLTPTNDELAVQPPKPAADHTHDPAYVNRENGKKEEARPSGTTATERKEANRAKKNRHPAALAGTFPA